MTQFLSQTFKISYYTKVCTYVPSKRTSWIINFRAICRDCVKEINLSSTFTPSDSLNSVPLATLSVDDNDIVCHTCKYKHAHAHTHTYVRTCTHTVNY